MIFLNVARSVCLEESDKGAFALQKFQIQFQMTRSHLHQVSFNPFILAVIFDAVDFHSDEAAREFLPGGFEIVASCGSPSSIPIWFSEFPDH